MSQNHKEQQRVRIPFTIGAPCRGRLFVGRSSEISNALKALETVGHAIVVGERRIGKTSFAHKLSDVLESKGYITCHEYLIPNDIENARALCILIGKIICEELASRLLNLKKMELRDIIRSSGAGILNDIQSSKKKKIFKAYIDIATSRASISGTKTEIIGASMVAKAEKQEHRQASINLEEISSRQAIEITKEMLDIAKAEGYSGIFIALDEANDLIEKSLKDIPTVLDTFAEIGIKLCFIGPPWGVFGRLSHIVSFPAAIVKIYGFQTATAVHEMLDACNIILQEASCELLSWSYDLEVLAHSVTRGYPMELQWLLDTAINELPNNSTELSIDAVLRAVERLIPDWQKMERRNREAAYQWMLRPNE